MVMRFLFVFELVGNFVLLMGFVVENYFCMTLGYVLFVVIVRFVCTISKDLVDRKDLVDQYSDYQFADLY